MEKTRTSHGLTGVPGCRRTIRNTGDSIDTRGTIGAGGGARGGARSVVFAEMIVLVVEFRIQQCVPITGTCHSVVGFGGGVMEGLGAGLWAGLGVTYLLRCVFV